MEKNLGHASSTFEVGGTENHGRYCTWGHQEIAPLRDRFDRDAEVERARIVAQRIAIPQTGGGLGFRSHIRSEKFENNGQNGF